jgi:hypothetical protein
VVSSLNFVLAVAAILMLPTGQQLSQPFKDTLTQATSKYNFSDKPVVNPPQLSNISSLQPVANSDTSQLKVANLTRPPRWINDAELSPENATKIWDSLQNRGCCGLTNGTAEWKDKIPKSCCADPKDESGEFKCKKVDENHQQGCLELIESTGMNLLIVLALIALVNLYLASISGISAYKTYNYSEASQNAYT